MCSEEFGCFIQKTGVVGSVVVDAHLSWFTMFWLERRWWGMGLHEVIEIGRLIDMLGLLLGGDCDAVVG